MFRLEALRARHGDCLLLHFGEQQLVVIDGGPPGVFKQSLEPRLAAIRKQRKLADGKPLVIELMMVSHIDADHIAGLLELVRRLKDFKDSKEPAPWRIKRFWHNSFDDTIATGLGASASVSASAPATVAAGGAAAVDAAQAFAADADVFVASKDLSPASIKQGRDLARLLPGLELDGNPPFEGLVEYRNGGNAKAVKFGDLTLTVIGPNEQNVALLRDDWAEKVVDVIKKEKDKAKATAIVADYVDDSPYNLSSIVMLAECQGKSMLFTGDGRGDHTLDELDKAGLLQSGVLKVDLLKVPHHGSSRDVELDYFQKIHAKHYVISADGKYSNPDIETLEMISKARPDDDFTIYLTYPYDEFTDLAVGTNIRKFVEQEHHSGRKYRVVTPAAGEACISVSL
jgi:hypothetical protein